METFEDEEKTLTPDKVINLSNNVEPSQISFSKPQTVTALVSIHGATYSTIQRNSRAPVDLIAVIDRSASMKNQMPLIQQTLMFMIKQLKHGDHLGLVVYDQLVEVMLNLTNMDAEGKHQAIFVVKKLEVGGQTNTSGGLLQGLNMIRTRMVKANDVTSVLLFTDGMANLGLTKPDQIKKAVRGVLSQISSVCSIFTFGYGSEPDPQYLRDIADEANGMYYHINAPEAIPLAFSDCLGGLLSVVAQNLELTIEAPKGLQLTEVTTNYKKNWVINNTAVKISIPDIYSEEDKDFLCTINLPPTDTPKQVPLLEVALTFTNVLSQKQQYLSESLTVLRVIDPEPAQINPKIDRQRNRIICANAMQEALDAGERSDYKRAVDILQKAERVIITSPSAMDNYCLGLVRQLQDGQREVSNRDQFRNAGQQNLSVATRTHQQQRGTQSTPHYTTLPKTTITHAFNTTKHQ
jgi:Mg-chelatase subunit ChlD